MFGVLKRFSGFIDRARQVIWLYVGLINSVDTKAKHEFFSGFLFEAA